MKIVWKFISMAASKPLVYGEIVYFATRQIKYDE